MNYSKKFIDKILLIDTHMRDFYAPGYSYMTLSFFNWDLSLSFYRYSGKDEDGFHSYDFVNDLTITLDDERVSYLYQTAIFILNEKDPGKEIKVEIPRYNINLMLERKPDDDGQMAVFLTIEKNGQSISFRFKTRTFKVTENGQESTMVVQSGLMAFAKTLEAYLTGTSISYHLKKMLDIIENPQDENQQVPNATTEDDGYVDEDFERKLSFTEVTPTSDTDF
jgi:hypothetical protein